MSIYNVFNYIAGVKYNEHLILNKPLLLIMLFVAVSMIYVYYMYKIYIVCRYLFVQSYDQTKTNYGVIVIRKVENARRITTFNLVLPIND